MPVNYSESKPYHLPKADWLLHFSALEEVARELLDKAGLRTAPYVSLKTREGAEVKNTTLRVALKEADDQRLTVERAYIAFHPSGRLGAAYITLSGRPQDGSLFVDVETTDEGFFHVSHNRLRREVEAITDTVGKGQETAFQSKAKRDAILRRAMAGASTRPAAATSTPPSASTSGPSAAPSKWSRTKKVWAAIVGAIVFLSAVATIVGVIADRFQN